jgi:hypothetical protein
MRAFIVRFGALLLTLSLIGCSGIPVNQDYDPQANFSNIRHVQWLPAEQQTAPSAQDFAQQHPLIAKRIENAVQQQLATKGIRLVTGHPDAYITYHISVRTRLAVEPASPTFGFGTYWRHGGVFWQTAPDVYEYEEGTVTIDLIDPQGHLLWRGFSHTHLTEQSTPQKTTELVNAVIGKILAQYPPKTEGAAAR